MSNDNRPRGTIRLRPAPALETRDGDGPDRPRTLLTKAAPEAGIAERGLLRVSLDVPAGAGTGPELGCMVAFTDGSGQALQPLGNAFGSLTRRPYVALGRDDRGGAPADGGTVRVDLGRRELFRRLLFYVYAHEDAVGFRGVGGVAATVTAPSGGFRIALDDCPAGATGCAVALAAPGPGGLTVRREVRWFTGADGQSVQEMMDRTYGFGFPWTWMTRD